MNLQPFINLSKFCMVLFITNLSSIATYINIISSSLYNNEICKLTLCLTFDYQEQGLYICCIHHNSCGSYDIYYDEVILEHYSRQLPTFPPIQCWCLACMYAQLLAKITMHHIHYVFAYMYVSIYAYCIVAYDYIL